MLRTRNLRVLRTACLLSKPSRRLVDVKVEYVGFNIEDHFVVGYGLDYAEHYRNLPHRTDRRLTLPTHSRVDGLAVVSARPSTYRCAGGRSLNSVPHLLRQGLRRREHLGFVQRAHLPIAHQHLAVHHGIPHIVAARDVDEV